MTNWLRTNFGVVFFQIVGVCVMGAIALAAQNSLDKYVLKEEWKLRNVAIDERFDKLDTSIREQIKTIQDSILAVGIQYVTQARWVDRNIVVDDRFDKLERFVTEGRVERRLFEKDVVERLARIEAMFSEHAKYDARQKEPNQSK